MADGTFKLKLVTPRGLEREEEVSSVSLPSSQGEIGVLPQHAKYTGLLGTGILAFTPATSSESVRVVISGGFCTFSDNTLSVLADSVDTPESVAGGAYSSEREKLLEVMKSSGPQDTEWVIAQSKLARIDAIDRLIGTTH